MFIASAPELAHLHFAYMFWWNWSKAGAKKGVLSSIGSAEIFISDLKGSWKKKWDSNQNLRTRKKADYLKFDIQYIYQFAFWKLYFCTYEYYWTAKLFLKQLQFKFQVANKDNYYCLNVSISANCYYLFGQFLMHLNSIREQHFASSYFHTKVLKVCVYIICRKNCMQIVDDILAPEINMAKK